MVFLPNDDEAEKKSIALIEEVAKKEGLKLVAWRDVPVDHSVVGRFAKITQPRIKQVFLESPDGLTGDALERELYLARKGMESLAEDRLGDLATDLFFCSCSTRTIVYKVNPFSKQQLPTEPSWLHWGVAAWLTLLLSRCHRACCGLLSSAPSTRT